MHSRAQITPMTTTMTVVIVRELDLSPDRRDDDGVGIALIGHRFKGGKKLDARRSSRKAFSRASEPIGPAIR